MKKLLLAVTLGLSLSACVSTQKPATTYTDYSKQATVEYDNFAKQHNYRAPVFHHIGTDVLGRDRTFFRSWKKNGKTTHQLYISDFYWYGWRFYHSAIDSEGRKFDITLISKDVDCNKYGCTYTEDLGLNVTEDYLQSKTETGIRLQMYSKSGEKRIIELPANYVKWYIQYVNAN